MRMLFRAERLLLIACPIVFFEVMFAHLTAIENIVIGMFVIGTFAAACSPARASLTRWPLMLPATLWAAWTLASLFWSPFPRWSARGWLDEVFYPLSAFFGCWLVASNTDKPVRAAQINWVACLLLATLSAVMWGRLQPSAESSVGLLHFYNRVGHTSTLAVFAMSLFTGLSMQGRDRWLGCTGLVLCLFIGLASLNRFFWLAASIVLLIALFPFYRRHLVLSAITVVILGTGALATLEMSARMRLGPEIPATTGKAMTIFGDRLHVPSWLTGVGDTVSGDTRPALWAFYREVGKQHKWIGVGFGKHLPGRVYGPQMPQRLLEQEPQAQSHAHNIFLNTWLEVGWVGVVLQAALLISLAVRFARVWRASPWIGAAGVALVVGMVAKNMADDFMWQTTMLAFWTFAGWLLGAGERAAGRVPAPQRPSTLE